jgi:head-tail adaptor
MINSDIELELAYQAEIDAAWRLHAKLMGDRTSIAVNGRTLSNGERNSLWWELALAQRSGGFKNGAMPR